MTREGCIVRGSITHHWILAPQHTGGEDLVLFSREVSIRDIASPIFLLLAAAAPITQQGAARHLGTCERCEPRWAGGGLVWREVRVIHVLPAVVHCAVAVLFVGHDARVM